MIKVFVVILLFFNLLSCGPVSKATKVNKADKPLSFVCLTSQSECEVNTKYGRFTIQFSGEPSQAYIKTELPFYVKLKFDAKNTSDQLKSISSYLEGKDMFMGKIPVFFENGAKQEHNLMMAESLLASCSEEIMTWLFWFNIEILVDGVVQQQDFLIEFDSKRL